MSQNFNFQISQISPTYLAISGLFLTVIVTRSKTLCPDGEMEPIN